MWKLVIAHVLYSQYLFTTMEDLVMELCELFFFFKRKGIRSKVNISSLELAEKELGEV